MRLLLRVHVEQFHLNLSDEEKDAMVEDLWNFILDRFEEDLIARGFNKSIITAVVESRRVPVKDLTALAKTYIAMRRQQWQNEQLDRETEIKKEEGMK